MIIRRTISNIQVIDTSSKNKRALNTYVKNRDKRKFYEEHSNTTQEREKEVRTIQSEIQMRMRQRGNLAMLEMLLLEFAFMQDDGKVSLFEKWALRKHFKRYNKRITQEDKTFILGLHDVSLNDAKHLIRQNTISKTDIHKAIRTVHKVCKKKNRYDSIIQEIKRTLFESYDY